MLMQRVIKSFLPHLIVIIGFIIIALAYFNPVLQGKKIFQSDIMHYIGMAEQHKTYAETEGESTYWTNSAFGGMPTYQLGVKYPHNYIKSLDLSLRFLPRPADYLFLYFIGFYILMLSLKVDFKLAALGALAFGFSTYLIIILGVGHNAKAHAIAYMPLVLSGIILAYREKYILGFSLTSLGLGLELVANHFQMTYYLLLLVFILGVVYFIDFLKRKALPQFFKASGVLIFAAILAVGLNATNILATQEYAQYSTRGESELTINPDGSEKEKTSGLSKAYITQYSYGVLESLNLFIPRFMGGGNSEDVGRDSETYKAYLNIGASPIEALEGARNAPTYWGDQPIVEAPAYIGAIVVFLFVLGLFLVKGRAKWWLLSGSILALLLSYGKNFSLLTNFFIDGVPLYDKFRAVSSIQVILELCVPALGILGLKELMSSKLSKEQKTKSLLYATLITAGIALFFLVFKSALNFEGLRDQQYIEAYGPAFIDAVIKDRQDLLTSDALRTLILVLLSSGALFLLLKQKLKPTVVIVVLAVLIAFDLVGVNKNYVNESNFVAARKVDKPYTLNAADKEILKDKGHFRVMDLSRSGQGAPAKASYYHNSLTGYHAAKLGRYNDVLEFHIYKNNMNVLNMLNTKYIIAEDEQGRIFPYTNTDANGNAWLVEYLKPVESANAEILALDSLSTKTTAVIQKRIINVNDLKTSYVKDSTAFIALEDVKPNYLKYAFKSSKEQFAVFSEIYYQPGWQAYLDKQPVPHHRVNYILRGLEIPAGEHTIEFKFEPEVVERGSTIALGSSILLAVLLMLGLGFQLKKRFSH